MALRDRLRRLMKEAEGDGFIVRFPDGTSKVFDNMDIRKALFLARVDLFRENSVTSEVLDAVRNATPESRARFEARYGPITPSSHIIGADGWVETYTLTEDGRVERVRHEGGSEEAERIRSDVRQQAWQ